MLLDEKGILSIEFSIVFSISIMLVVLVLNISIFLYQRYLEIYTENEEIIDDYQKNIMLGNNQFEIEMQYANEESPINISYLGLFDNYKYKENRNEKYLFNTISYLVNFNREIDDNDDTT